MKSFSTTHCVKRSRWIGQASSSPVASVTCVFNASSVAGVIESTIDAGNRTVSAIQRARSGSDAAAHPAPPPPRPRPVAPTI